MAKYWKSMFTCRLGVLGFPISTGARRASFSDYEDACARLGVLPKFARAVQDRAARLGWEYLISDWWKMRGCLGQYQLSHQKRQPKLGCRSYQYIWSFWRCVWFVPQINLFWRIFLEDFHGNWGRFQAASLVVSSLLFRGTYCAYLDTAESLPCRGRHMSKPLCLRFTALQASLSTWANQ